MSESRLVPSNLMSWPSVRNMVPDQRLILYHLWATCKSTAGVDIFDPGVFSGCLGMRESVIIDSWQHMQDRCLVLMDEVTGEIMLNNWFRYHHFKGLRMSLLINDVDKIHSINLKNKISQHINDLKDKQRLAKLSQDNNKPVDPVDENTLKDVAHAIYRRDVGSGFQIGNVESYINQIYVRLLKTGPRPSDLDAYKQFKGNDPLAA